MKRILMLTVAMATLIGTPGYASIVPSTSNAVFVGGTPIMRVRVGAGGFTPEQRATRIQARLNTFLGMGPISPDEITTRASGDEAEVDVKGQLFVTADWATARYNQATPAQLAEQWAENLRRVLPGLTEAK